MAKQILCPFPFNWFWHEGAADTDGTLDGGGELDGSADVDGTLDRDSEG